MKIYQTLTPLHVSLSDLIGELTLLLGEVTGDLTLTPDSGVDPKARLSDSDGSDTEGDGGGENWSVVFRSEGERAGKVHISWVWISLVALGLVGKEGGLSVRSKCFSSSCDWNKQQIFHEKNKFQTFLTFQIVY